MGGHLIRPLINKMPRADTGLLWDSIMGCYRVSDARGSSLRLIVDHGHPKINNIITAL